ncbi:MAG: pilus assembly protein PilP [Acidobacteriota bacterium]|nr:pilus assembly protein PilP [Acidobacteriota bacterium]
MHTPVVLVVVLLAGLTAETLHAQKPKAPAPAAPAAAPGPPLPAPPPNFQYSPDGRRDPFVDLVNRGTDAVRGNNASAKRPDGVPGLETNAIVVRGIMLSRGAFLAMVAGPDGKVFTVRAGDKLFDGVIRSITAQAVVILQEVNDPLSLEKQREVRKFLRGGEEVK